MGMTFDPDVIAAGKKALDEFGSGTTGSRVLNGTYAGHKAVEQALKDFYGTEHAMVFSTGYQANLGIISTIAGKDDYIFLDIDSHASIYDGCKMGDAQIVPFRHNDLDALEKRLKRVPDGAGKLVILEGVYSMLGDVAPLAEMVPLAKKYGAMVLSTRPIRWLHRAQWPRVAEEQASSTIATSIMAPFEVGRHGAASASQPSQFRDSAPGLAPLCRHRSLPRRSWRRGDLDPQTAGR